ncbi:MAG: helix-turn-helix domain-containing protein [Defluviitaleaceae bacterium]|nr:helix-turn-helix domain-containing protein [Defluviitaleaceae bacterium]MCL2273460.1 helix-turn-helix domain-containing protein [Defluviitaleaceae bacterium]
MNFQSAQSSAYNLSTLDGYRDILNVSDLCTIFDVSKQTIYKELQNGKFGTPIRIGCACKVPKIYIQNQFFNVCDS